MPNLTLTHNGNMNITNAEITSSSTLSVSYEPNNSGSIAGWSSFPLPGSQYETGDTITVRFTPDITGNVLSETFVVSGIDKEGVRRSGTSVLRQGYDSDLRHYLSGMELTAVWNCTINSTAATSNYLDVNLTVSEDPYSDGFGFAFSGAGYYSWYGTIDLPDTGSTVVTSITISVASDIIDSGVASYSYSPVDAIANVSFSSSDPDVASIDPTTGEITVFQDGIVQFCVTDSISELQDCATVEVFKTPDTGDTGSVITYLELNVPSQIIESGIAVPVYAPSDVDVSFVFTSSDPSVATIDEYGNITVLNNGSVTFCVLEEYSGLVACKTVIVRKAKYINSIEIDVPDSIFVSGVASSIYTPADASVWLIYTSSDPSIASIDPNTGEITANESGTVTFCVRDLYTNMSDCKEVDVVSFGPNYYEYLTIEATTNGTIVLSPNVYFKYKYNNGDWSNYTSNETFNVSVGDKILLKSSCDLVEGEDMVSIVSGGSTTAYFKVYGNIMSWFYEDDFMGKTDMHTSFKIDSYGSWGPFAYCTTLTDASDLVIPVFDLTDSVYKGRTMFYDCESLVSPPFLYATTADSYCYYYMFARCTSLTTAPALPATTLATNCYGGMFSECTSLTTAPALPATTLEYGCYWNMFYGCTSLTSAQDILPAMTLTSNCYALMFAECTSLLTAPVLPAATLAERCYSQMFQGCSSLQTVQPVLPATSLTRYCYEQMFYGCASLTASPVLPALYLAQGCYSALFSGCTSLTYIKAMFTTTPNNNYTSNWVKGVATTGTFVKNSSATWTTTGNNGVPSGWTVQTASS